MTAAASVEITFKMFSINFNLSMGSSFHFSVLQHEYICCIVWYYWKNISVCILHIRYRNPDTHYSLNGIKHLYIIKPQTGKVSTHSGCPVLSSSSTHGYPEACGRSVSPWSDAGAKSHKSRGQSHPQGYTWNPSPFTNTPSNFLCSHGHLIIQLFIKIRNMRRWEIPTLFFLLFNCTSTFINRI